METKSYKKVKRAAPAVVDFSTCSHTFGNTWQKTTIVKHSNNLPTTHVGKFQTCTTCGYNKQVQ